MATTRITKEKALVDDLDLGLGDGTGSRGGKQINASTIPFSSSNSIADELATKKGDTDNDTRYAKLGGNTNQLFNVQTPTSADNAVNLAYLNAQLGNYPLTTQVASALATKAEKAGSSAQAFNVASPAYPNLPNASETVNFAYLGAWFDGAIQPQIDGKANALTTLDTVVEHASYVPTLPMHPSTKAYVDQKVVDIGAGDMTTTEYVANTTASKAVFSTKSVGDFGSPMGISDADQIMRLSPNLITDINNIQGFGIHVGAVDGMLGDLPPASAGSNLAVEQLVIDDGTLHINAGLEAVVLVGQRATTDQGYFTRFGNGSTYGNWAKSATEADIGVYAYSKNESDTTNQAQDILIAVNTAKVGITQSQADAIIANTAKVSYSDATLVAQHTSDIAANTTLAESKIASDSYSSSTVGGTLKSRISGTTLYLTNDGSDA